jgi:hypothetical protein
MIIPEEFKAMCWRLNQDNAATFTTLEELINYITSDLTPGQLVSIKAYLEKLHSEGRDDKYLMSVWRRAGADLVVSCQEEGGIADFFSMIQSAIIEIENAAR